MTSPNHTQNLTISIPITSTERQVAQQFAQEQLSQEKAAQVYLNTLAVLVTHHYLQMLDVATDLRSSYCWNPAGRLCSDVADLKINNLGHLECRPIRANEQACLIPPDVWYGRLGYVIVQIDQTCRQGTVLGFVPRVTRSRLPLTELQPLEKLLTKLHTVSRVRRSFKPPVQLRQWFNQRFEVSWRAIEDLLTPAQLGLAFRHQAALHRSENQPSSVVRRVKLIDLGMHIAGHTVALLVEIRPESTERFNICIQVHPTGHKKYLPPDLQLIVSDLEENTVSIQARDIDNYIQLQFTGQPEEQFEVTVTLQQISITEIFEI